MSNNFKFSMLFPLMAVLMVALYGGTLGIIFILLSSIKAGSIPVAVIVLGSSLVIGVPIVAYLLTRNEAAE